MITRTNNPDESRSSLAQLEKMLLEQVELIKNGNIQEAQNLTGQATVLLAKIVPPPAPRRPQWTRQCRRIYQLYQQLTLMIEAQKAALKTQQQKIGSGKKTMRAYHSKI